MADGTPITTAFEPLIMRWADALAVANATARISLSGPVSQLQAIRQDVRSTAWPPCGRAAADLLLAGMNSQISGLLGFMVVPRSDDTKDVAGVGRYTYGQLVGVVGQERADDLFFADSYAAMTIGREYFGEFATELAYADGEQPRPI